MSIQLRGLVTATFGSLHEPNPSLTEVREAFKQTFINLDRTVATLTDSDGGSRFWLHSSPFQERTGCLAAWDITEFRAPKPTSGVSLRFPPFPACFPFSGARSLLEMLAEGDQIARNECAQSGRTLSSTYESSALRGFSLKATSVLSLNVPHRYDRSSSFIVVHRRLLSFIIVYYCLSFIGSSFSSSLSRPSRSWRPKPSRS
jgi:hypothetical protein